MPSFCVVSNCEHKYASATNISFHKFPLNSPELLKKWIEFTDRGPDWFPSKWSSICSRHFLPSDFRIQHLRKCLKRTAYPSVTMKSLDFNSIPANDFNENHYKAKRIICRLCARGGAEGQSKSIFELNSTLVKCLPTIRLDTLETLPNDVCGDCIKKLVQFSLFIDRVVSVQKELFGINAETDGVLASTTKPIIIKQEPVANIKQEIFEFNKSTRVNAEDPFNASAHDDYADAESDAYCEFCDVYFMNNVELKNHIVDFHSDSHPCNPRERANNCEIMEIITLENAAFIDLDENGIEEPSIPSIPQLERVLKVEKNNDTDQREVLIQIISIEHNYASTSSSVDASDTGPIVRHLKQEEMNVQVKSLIQTEAWEQSTEPVIEPIEVVETEIIETETLTEKCIKCNEVFESQSALNEHVQTIHVPKTKICPICTAHCRTIYHYFIHRSKYHNWSKPRRPKRKFHYKCGDCSKMFLSKFAFDNHNKYSCSTLRFTCSICQLEFSSGMSMLIHRRICKVLMAKSETIVDTHAKVNRRLKTHAHRKAIHSSTRNGHNLWQQTSLLRRQRTRNVKEIKSYNVTVPSVNAMDSSRINKHRDNANALLPLKSRCLNKQYTCSCGKHFKTLKKFNAHQSAHTTDAQPLYRCKVCNKEFPIRSYLHQHLVTHDNERKYKCTMCTKEFKRLAGLNQHIRGYHYKIKPHVCTVCKHSYALKGDMRRCRHSTLQNKT